MFGHLCTQHMRIYCRVYSKQNIHDLISNANISGTHNGMYLLGLKPAIFCVKSEMSFLCRNIHTNGITNGTTYKHKHTRKLMAVGLRCCRRAHFDARWIFLTDSTCKWQRMLCISMGLEYLLSLINGSTEIEYQSIGISKASARVSLRFSIPWFECRRIRLYRAKEEKIENFRNFGRMRWMNVKNVTCRNEMHVLRECHAQRTTNNHTIYRYSDSFQY